MPSIAAEWASAITLLPYRDKSLADKVETWGGACNRIEEMLSGRRIPETIALAALIANAVQVGFWYPKLPARLATSFDAVGNPQAHGSKSSIFGVLLAAVFIYALLSVIAEVLPRLPAYMINAPYPLTDENRGRFMALLQRFVSWIKAWTELTFFVVTFMIINAAATGNAQFAATMCVYALIGATVVTVLIYIVQMYRAR